MYFKHGRLISCVVSCLARKAQEMENKEVKWMDEPIDPSELKELLALLEAQELMDMNEQAIPHLYKHGIKLRRYQWSEFDAS